MEMELTLLQIIIIGAIVAIVILGFIYIISENRAYKKEMEKRSQARKAQRNQREMAWWVDFFLLVMMFKSVTARFYP